ncbi:MAG TPA: hypothetical protein VK395_25790 [Gemmataceae bacterium]|nr:hypothetical protein [Gemmataceae bacterium]
MPDEVPLTPGQRSPPPALPAEVSGPHRPLPASAGTPSSTALRFSKKRLALAIAIAGISDVIGAFVALSPPIVWVVDFVTAVLLFIVLGWHWLLLPGLVMEAIPGVSVLPFWLLVVGGIAVWGTARPKLR